MVLNDLKSDFYVVQNCCCRLRFADAEMTRAPNYGALNICVWVMEIAEKRHQQLWTRGERNIKS
jgi:hypothetical protein